jgi:hypothetical protein
MTGATPTTDELDLALHIAERIDGADYRQKIAGNNRKVRVAGLRNIICDEIMQFNRQEPKKDDRQGEIEW